MVYQDVFDQIRSAGSKHEEFNKQVAQGAFVTEIGVVFLPEVASPMGPGPVLNDIEAAGLEIGKTDVEGLAGLLVEMRGVSR